MLLCGYGNECNHFVTWIKIDVFFFMNKKIVCITMKWKLFCWSFLSLLFNYATITCSNNTRKNLRSLRFIRFQRRLSLPQNTRTLLYLYCLRKHTLIYLQACLLSLKLLFVRSIMSKKLHNGNFPFQKIKINSYSSIMTYG